MTHRPILNWSDDDVKLLIELHGANIKVPAMISNLYFPGRTVQSIRTKLTRLYDDGILTHRQIVQERPSTQITWQDRLAAAEIVNKICAQVKRKDAAIMLSVPLTYISTIEHKTKYGEKFHAPAWAIERVLNYAREMGA